MKQLEQLIQGLGLRQTHGRADAPVADLADDSRRVVPGSLFIARAGVGGDGVAYIVDALDRGATAILAPAGTAPPLPDDIARIEAPTDVAVDHALVSRLAERFFDHPTEKLSLLGVTGTNGKTTVAFLTRHLLNAAGIKTGLIGTIEIDDGVPPGTEPGRGPRPAELTTPGPVDLSRLFAQMVEHGCRAAVMEVSSHALHQGRTAGLRFHAAAFTNLTGDHLDYHGSMDAYASAKRRLFGQLTPGGWAVINADDPYAVRMLDACACRVLWTTLDPVMIADARANAEHATPLSFAYGEVVDLRADGSRAQFTGPWGSLDLTLPLIGRHNVANALQATALAGCVTDISRTLRRSLETCPQVPGRLERVGTDQPAGIPAVLVDYAHTHDALENVLAALRPVTPGRLIALVGCGGDRDKTKRPKMARIAADLADVVWITSDNPRSEDPDAIIKDMVEGISDGGFAVFDWRHQTQSSVESRDAKINIMTDRAAAIDRCIRAAGPDDTVLIAGKGHEDYQIIAAPDAPGGTIKTHFDDREHAAAALGLWLQTHAPITPQAG